MSEHQYTDDLHDLEPPLATAVHAVLTLTQEPPEEAVSRVIDRAKRLEIALSGSSSRTSAPQARVRKWSRRRILAWTASGVSAAAAVLALFLFSRSTSVSWAEMLAAVDSRPWVHGTTTYSDGQHSVTSESWVSTGDRFAAFKLGGQCQFEDIETGISLQFDAGDGAIYRVPSLRPGAGFTLVGEGRLSEAHLPGLLDRLIADQGDSRDLFHGERVIKSERHQEAQNGKQWLEYLIHLERIDNAALHRTVRIRLDRATQLPESWEERQANGTTAVTRFDYPDSGPRNIYDLGVPRTAKLIDRVPKGDLARIIAAQRADRKRFDAYDAIVVQHTEGRPSRYDDLMNLSVRRVRRKGGEYRVDQLLVAKPGLVVPAPGTDMQQWWKENRDRYLSVPLLICDGRTVHFYKMLDDRIAPGKKPNLTVVASREVPIGLPTDDSPVESPNLMPEQCSRPHLWDSDRTREFDVNVEAKDGPQGTMRVIVTKKSEPRSGELFRYWFDPDRDYILRKEISAVFDARTNELAYLDTQEYDELVQSPSGRWYPQRVRRATSDNPRWQGVTRFFLDFETGVNEELFLPID
jgi:hypothetical protein